MSRNGKQGVSVPENRLASAHRRTVRRQHIRMIVTYALLGVWGVVVLFPFYWMVLTSLKSYSAYSSESIPKFLHCTRPWRIIGKPLRRCRLHGIS